MIFKRFKTEYEVLNDYDCISVTKTLLKPGNKDFSKLILGVYSPLYPVEIFHILNCTKSVGWVCKILDTDEYQILSAASLGKLQLKYQTNMSYFGAEYVSSENLCKKLNVSDFKKEFIEEVNLLEPKYEFQKQDKEMYLLELDKYAFNLEKNLKMFKSYNKLDFNNELSRIVEKYKFIQIEDLSSISNCLYILVFDEYNVFYIGKCVNSLKNRTRKHWFAKIIPNRQLWFGGFNYSRIKVDNFQLFDTTRIFVCKDFDFIIKNSEFADDERIRLSNTFGVKPFTEMTTLDKVERIVINDCLCKYCLSDRVPLMDDPIYLDVANYASIPIEELKIWDYICYYWRNLINKNN